MEGGCHFRLRGDVGGAERAYPVARGETRIGSVGGNDIVLPVRGVSRRHALVSASAESVAIRDLESKNGVFVNGARVESTRLAPGDEIHLGPVTLWLEEVPAEDVELALVVHGGAPPATDGLPTWQTTASSSGEGAGVAWLRLVDAVLERLCVLPEADLVGALGLVVRDLRAEGGGVLEFAPGAEALVLAACGAVPDLSAHERFQELVSDAASPPETLVVSAASLAGEPALTCALLSARGIDTLGLVLWGDFPERADIEPLLRTLVRLLQRFRPQPVRILQHRPGVAVRGLVFPDGYVQGPSPAMASLYGQMRPLLQGDLPVLILGETGVGKELIARALHASSDRCEGPFVAVNCAAIPSELLEAEMFGIGKGVATGVTERPGKFRLAEGGTLFLDEIGDMPLDLQAKLLRALQEKEIQPVGSAPVPVDIRVLAATNSDLQRRLQEGRFRRDLYYRLAGFALEVPALRQRKEDVPSLVEGLIRGFSRDVGKSIRGITVKALRTLTDHDWPGNVRELEHELRRLVHLCPDGEAIDSTMLSPQLLVPPAADEPVPEPEGASLTLETRLQRVEDRLIRQALSRAGGNRTQAAKLLGISRNGLAIKMRRLGIPG